MMTQDNIERTLRFRLDFIQDQDDTPPEEFIEWAVDKADESNVEHADLKQVLTNHVSQDAKQVFDLDLKEWYDLVESNVPIEDDSLPDQDPKLPLRNDELDKRERYDKASEIIARGFEQQHHAKTIFSDKDPRIFYYKNGYYQENGKSKVYEYSRRCLGELFTKKLGDRVAEKVRTDTYIDKDEFYDAEPGRLCVKNGVLDLEEQELHEHTPQEVHFQRLNVEYDEDASYNELTDFLQSLFKDDDQIKVVQEIFGFCLYRQYFLKKAVIFHGDVDNGKSTVIDILTRLLGDENISGIKLQKLGQRFQKASLVNKLANIVGDLPSEELKQTGDFKALTGGDPMNYEVKNGGHYTFENYAKIIYSANDLPRVRNPTPAFFSRWIIINFPYTFVEPSQYDEYSNEYIEDNDIKEAEPNPVENLFEQQSLSGVLNFALDGLQRLLANNEFSYTRSREENMIEWVRQSSSFQAFCMDCLEEDPDSYIVKEDLSDAYRKYCKYHNVKHNKDSKFRKDYLVDEFGVNRDRVRKTVGDSRPSVWEGISFKAGYEAGWKTLTEEQSSFDLSGAQQNKDDSHSSDSVVDEAEEETITVTFAEGDKIYAEDYHYDFENSKLVNEGAVIETNPNEYEVLQADVVEEVLL